MSSFPFLGRRRLLDDVEYSKLSDDQLQSAGLQEPSESAPADFGGAVLPNPTHIKPHWDTDPIPETRLPNGVTFKKDNWKGTPSYDVSNPNPADVFPDSGREIKADFSPSRTQSMGAFNIPQGSDLGSAFNSDPGNRKRLLQMVMGSDASATMDPPQNDRIADDTSRHPQVRQQQDAQPSHLDQLQSQYDKMQPPQPSKISPWKMALTGLLTGGVGIPLMLKGRQEQQNFQEERYDRNRASLLNQIENERKMQQQGELEMGKEDLAQRMETERERARQASQERMFGQQSQIEGQRETLRQKMQQEAENQRQQQQQSLFDQQDKRQNATFAQQQNLERMRESNRQQLQQEKENVKPSADEQRRADLARNMNENLDQLEDILNRRSDLFGKVGGRATNLRTWVGTDDQDIAKLNAISEYMGMAAVGAHAMRNAQHVETAANAIKNSYHNSPEAIKAAIDSARASLATFQQDAGQQPGSAPKGSSLKSDAGLAPPRDPKPGMKWQHRTTNGRTEWREVPAQ